jgi:hypothetical protein
MPLVPARPKRPSFWNIPVAQEEVLSVAVNRPSETQTLRAVERLMNDALPPRWSFRSMRETAKGNRRPVVCA